MLLQLLDNFIFIFFCTFTTLFLNERILECQKKKSPRIQKQNRLSWGKTKTKDKIRKFISKEKYKIEYFLNNLNCCWGSNVQQTVGGLGGGDERASDG